MVLTVIGFTHWVDLANVSVIQSIMKLLVLIMIGCLRCTFLHPVTSINLLNIYLSIFVIVSLSVLLLLIWDFSPHAVTLLMMIPWIISSLVVYFVMETFLWSTQWSQFGFIFGKRMNQFIINMYNLIHKLLSMFQCFLRY